MSTFSFRSTTQPRGNWRRGGRAVRRGDRDTRPASDRAFRCGDRGGRPAVSVLVGRLVPRGGYAAATPTGDRGLIEPNEPLQPTGAAIPAFRGFRPPGGPGG